MTLIMRPFLFLKQMTFKRKTESVLDNAITGTIVYLSRTRDTMKIPP